MAGFLFYLSGIRPDNSDKANDNTQRREPVKVVKQKRAPTNQSTENDYDFYTLLPESEVIAPKVEEYSSSVKQSVPQAHYLLQAGSFRNRGDADRLRAKLIIRGLDVRMQAVKSSDGVIWHRILLGPFESRSKLNQAQDILADANTESMLIKIKPGKN